MIVGEWPAPSGEQWARNYRAQKQAARLCWATNRADVGQRRRWILSISSALTAKIPAGHHARTDERRPQTGNPILSAAGGGLQFDSDTDTWPGAGIHSAGYLWIAGEQKLSMTGRRRWPGKLSGRN